MRTRTDDIRDTDMPNFVVVSVRLSREDVGVLQKRSATMGVGVSTYIRMLGRQRLASEAKGAGAERGRDADGPFDEVAATVDRVVMVKSRSRSMRRKRLTPTRLRPMRKRV
jgi:hypothetical protein